MSFASDIGRMVARGPLRRMDENESRSLVMVTLLFAGLDLEQKREMFLQVLGSSFTLKILTTRYNYHFKDHPFEPDVLVWFSLLADRPGTCILLLAVLAYMVSEGKELTMDNVMLYFGEGIPSEVNYSRAWDNQKLTESRKADLGIANPGSDNVLDHEEAWA